MAAVPTTTVGVTGQTWRAAVSAWGAVTPLAGPDERTLEWYVAADDRWHRPANEPTVRQRRVDGTPVIETRVRIPDGDAVQRVWSVADGGGFTIVEIENDSPLPFAVAFAGRPVLTERPPADAPIEGIDLPDDAIVLPVGHRAAVRVALAHRDVPAGPGEPARLSGAPGASDVARGWTAVAARAGRVDLPDPGLAEAVVAARCDLMLDGPIDAAVDPIGFVLDVGELVRCGEPADPWLAEVVVPIESVARSGDHFLAAALDAAARIAVAASDDRALGDIVRLRARVNPATRPAGSFAELRRAGSAGRFVHDVERHLACGGELLPAGIPTRWFGSNFEVHGVPTGDRSAVSYAVRWHGERPAVLWEQTGESQRLTAPGLDAAWSTAAPAGEALWAAPPRVNRAPLSVTAVPEDGSASFS
ncbi:MAG: hypothetical protein HKN44_01110 [Ilumatobacter sp.]|nr:hypothetical protein [Ilumatobacter sp.]